MDSAQSFQMFSYKLKAIIKLQNQAYKIHQLNCLVVINLVHLQNILKRTTPGSRDEDTATKALNELKKVSKVGEDNL